MNFPHGFPFPTGGFPGNVRFASFSSMPGGIPGNIHHIHPDMMNPSPPGTHIELYNELEITHDASNADIISAYKRLRIQKHPDKPKGSKEQFQKLKEAYDILIDPETRNVYDKFGRKGIEAHKQTAGSSNFRSGRTEPKIKPVHVPLKISIDTLFKARNVDVSFKRAFISNGKHNVSVVSESVHVPRGVPDEHKIVLLEKGHVIENSGKKGDVVVHVEYMEHPLFRCEGYELIYKLKLSFRVSFLGGLVNVPMYNNDGILLNTDIVIPPRIVLKNNILSVPNGGIPLGMQGTRGSLVLQCEVDMSDLYTVVLSSELTRLLKEELPIRDDESEYEETDADVLQTAVKFDESEAQSRIEWGREHFTSVVDDEYADETEFAQGVQCAHQ